MAKSSLPTGRRPSTPKGVRLDMGTNSGGGWAPTPFLLSLSFFCVPLVCVGGWCESDVFVFLFSDGARSWAGLEMWDLGG